MTDRLDGSASSAWPGHPLGRWRWVPVVTGIGFTVSWLAGLALPVPSPAVNAAAAEVLDKYGPHLAMVQAQFALTEGLPALGLVIVAVALLWWCGDPGPV